MKLIGLTGAIGSGKTTVASILCQNHGYTELTFKSAMVDCLSFIFQCDKAIFYDRDTKEQPNYNLHYLSPRKVMQTFGTDWGRKMISQHIWVDRVQKELFPKLKTDDCIVISDVRFENEAQMIKRLGGRIWKIERKDNPFSVETFHESELGLPVSYIDLTIANDDSLRYLEDVLDLALKQAPSFFEGSDIIPNYYGA